MAAKPTITTVTGQADNNAFQVNTATDELADAVATCLERDGTDSMAGDLNMDGNKITNLGQGVASTDVASIGDIEDAVLSAGSVKYSYIQDLAANNVFLGNDDGAGSTVQEITAAEARTILGVEAGATAYQTDAEIKTAYENNANTEAYTTAEQTKVGYISVSQAVDLDTIETNSNASKVITDWISVTQAVDLDTMESNIATNNAKVTNATHTGEVTGSGALTIADDIIDEANLKMEDAGSNGKVLSFNSAKDGGLEWVSLPSAATISDTAYTRAGWDGNTTDAASKNALSDAFYNMVRYEAADTGAANCTFIGETGNTTNTCINCNFTGGAAGAANTSGPYNNFYGQVAGTLNEDGERNSYFGHGRG